MTALHSSRPKTYGPNSGMLKLLGPLDEPLGFEAGDANLYRYVGNAPTVNVDPSGLDLVPIDDPMRERLRPPASPRPGQIWNDPGFKRELPVVWPTPEERERDEIIRRARKSFQDRREPKNLWPNAECERQAMRSFDDIGNNWEYWDLKGVSGWRWRWWMRVPGYNWPMFKETENAIGVYPKPGNPWRPFVIDPFHGYWNNSPDIVVYPDVEFFFLEWPWGRNENSWK